MATHSLEVPLLRLMSSDAGHATAVLEALQQAWVQTDAPLRIHVEEVGRKVADVSEWLVIATGRGDDHGDTWHDGTRRYIDSRRIRGVLILEFFGRQLTGSRLRLGATTRVDQEVGTRGIQNSVRRFVSAMLKNERAEAGTWMEATERLLHYVGRLLDERAVLEHQLAQALEDRDVALTRARELELLYDTLRAERYETKDQLDKTFLVLCATAIFTLLGPIAGVALDHALKDDVAGARTAAAEVYQDCGDTNITIELPPIERQEQ